VFILAAVTDALDGHLARKWGVVSLFGRVMDPFADKLLVLGGCAYLSGAMFAVHDLRGHWYQVSGVYPAMAVVVLARELLITSLRGVFESRGVSFAATASGKWKMILQSVCIPLVLLLLATTDVMRFTETGLELSVSGYVVIAVVWATVIVTVWSGLPYVLRAIRESGKLSEIKP
jgi:CDP-diacylglycerol--glycerol-3-phosphate 3-phosphatidyltransferase